MSGKAVKGLKVECLQVMDCDGNVDKRLMPALNHQQTERLSPPSPQVFLENTYARPIRQLEKQMYEPRG